MTKQTNEKSVLKVNRYGDDAFYADWDEDTALFCVFGNESGRAYSSYAGMEQALQRAHEMEDELYSRGDRQMTKQTNEKSVLKVNRYGDDAFYADWDEDTALFCVFGNESGRAYSSYAGMEQAEARVEAMTETLCRL